MADLCLVLSDGACRNHLEPKACASVEYIQMMSCVDLACYKVMAHLDTLYLD